jgi:hypothetical protein
MIKLLITLGLLFSACYGFSQNYADEPQNVIVNWKVGTSKTISQIDSTIVYSNDTIMVASRVSSKYTIKVLSQKDTVYEVRFKQIIIDDNISLESDLIDASPIEKMLQELIIEIQKQMAGLEYSFLVDQNTALAFEVKNQQELGQLIEEMVVVFLNQFLNQAKIELETTEKNEIQLKVKQLMVEQMPAAMQTMLNAFNYIFQAYSFPFILDKTYTQDVDVYAIDQTQHEGMENKAKVIVNSSSTNSELEIDYKYLYNKEDAYQSFIVDQGHADQISIDEFDIDERVVSKFDIQSSWIKSSTSIVKAKMGNLDVYNTTYVTIK